jgi:hypothetical protein
LRRHLGIIRQLLFIVMLTTAFDGVQKLIGLCLVSCSPVFSGLGADLLVGLRGDLESRLGAAMLTLQIYRITMTEVEIKLWKSRIRGTGVECIWVSCPSAVIESNHSKKMTAGGLSNRPRASAESQGTQTRM